MRIKLIIYEICIKTMSANGSIGKTRSSEVKKNVNHTHILHVYICIYIYISHIKIYLSTLHICTYVYIHTYTKPSTLNFRYIKF